MSLRADIDRGLEIREAMEKLAVELKDIEARVKHAAIHGEQVDLNDADREGKQYLAAGSTHCVPVILTADMIVGSFKNQSATHLKITDALGEKYADLLPEFFQREVKFANVFDDGKKFRLQASEHLGPLAPAFITACLARDKDGIPKNAIKIMWEETKPKN